MVVRFKRAAPLVLLLLPFLAGLAEVAYPAEQAIVRSEEAEASIRYRFSKEDEQLLDEIQRGCFEFFWKEVGDPVPLVKDRLTNSEVSSLAGVGFQLSALPIGVERGWITQRQGEERAHAILQAIIDRDDNKKHGIYLCSVPTQVRLSTS
jgi:hypothetical protein